VTRHEEFAVKLERIRGYMDAHNLSAVALTRTDNFAWATCGGDNHVATAADSGVATLVVTDDAATVVTNNIEAARIEQEELDGLAPQVISFDWHEERLAELVREIGGARVGADTGIPGAQPLVSSFNELRWQLTDSEIARYRWLGRRVSEAVGGTCKAISPGHTEDSIAGLLSAKLLGQGITPAVLLVAVDDRIEQYRHPIPKLQELKRCAMVVTCGRKWGLIVSCTRLVHFGPLPDELRRKHQACCDVDAAFILATQPEAAVSDIFAGALHAYARAGYADEWTLHHQGGATGYATRDYKATLHDEHVVRENQAFAWNPSITGTKSEDTILATADGPEVLSAAEDWPMVTARLGDREIHRPDILVR
jgi:Xaa-Pro aminopeptidase